MQLSPAVRRAALAAAAGVATAGLMAGVLLLGPVAASVLLAVVFALVWPLAIAIRHVSEDTSFDSPLLVASIVAGGVLCVPGLVRLLTWGAAGVLTAAVAAVVFVLVDLVIPRRRLSRRRWRSSYGKLVQLSVSEESDQPPKAGRSRQRTLTTEELCRVWQETAVALESAEAQDREAVAEVRRVCLDEFERRNPDGFQRWIDAGAPSDPTSFLLPAKDE